jgi:hypothetical protein
MKGLTTMSCQGVTREGNIFIEDRDRKLFLTPGHRVRGETKEDRDLVAMRCGRWDFSGMRK